MELLDGIDLETLVQRLRAAAAERAVICSSPGLRLARRGARRGLVHRDIKPANIFVCRYGHGVRFRQGAGLRPGEADCDDAPQTRADARGRGRGTRRRSWRPRWRWAKPIIDGRADLYALGCVGYWLLDRPSGVPRGDGGGDVDGARAGAARRALRADGTAGARGAGSGHVMHCLEKDPAARPESARRLLEMLAECGVEPWTPREAERWWRTIFRRVGCAAPRRSPVR